MDEQEKFSRAAFSLVLMIVAVLCVFLTGIWIYRDYLVRDDVHAW